MPDNQGLYDKYEVRKKEDGTLVYDCFVLKPYKDLAARKALRKYAEETRNDILSRELLEWLAEFEDFACPDPGRGMCEWAGSPVCCCHCNKYNFCYDEGRICSVAYENNVLDISECVKLQEGGL